LSESIVKNIESTKDGLERKTKRKEKRKETEKSGKMSKGPWRSTRPKVPTTAMYTMPGPKYTVPSGLAAASTMKDKNHSLYQSPAYSIAHPYAPRDKTVGPGPSAYKPDPRYTHNGKAGGPYAFSTWKPKDPLERRGPGPTDYDTTRKNNVWSKLRNAPASSMGSRDKGPGMSSGPGPSAYNIEKKQLDFLQNKAPEIVIGGRFSDSKANGIPGPGTYQDAPLNRYKKGSPPAYSMGLKWTESTLHPTPSPNAYDVAPGRKRTKKEAPHFSFGNHHSEYSSSVLTKNDVDGDCGVCDGDDYCRDTAPPKPADCPPVEC